MLSFIPVLIKNWRVMALIAVLVSIISTIGFAYWHYTGLLGTIEELKVENSQLGLSVELHESQIAQQEIALHEWEKSQQELQERYQELWTVTQQASKETKRLHELFSRHNFSELTAKKPGLIENRVNNGTSDLFRMLECETSNKCGRDSPS